MTYSKFRQNNLCIVISCEFFDPCCKVYMVAYNCIIHLLACSAYVSNDNLPWIYTNTAIKHLLPFFPPFLLHLRKPVCHIQCAPHSKLGMIRLLGRRPPEGHYLISNKFVQSTIPFKDNIRHLFKIFI